MLTYATGAIAPAPNPWTARAATRIPIAGASPPTVKPIPNSTKPTPKGRAGPPATVVPPPPTSPTSAALPGAADAGGTRWTSSSVMTEGCRLGRIAASVEQPEKLPCQADVFGRAQDVVVEGEPAEPRLEVRPECLGGFFW